MGKGRSEEAKGEGGRKVEITQETARRAALAVRQEEMAGVKLFTCSSRARKRERERCTGHVHGLHVCHHHRRRYSRHPEETRVAAADRLRRSAPIVAEGRYYRHRSQSQSRGGCSIRKTTRPPTNSLRFSSGRVALEVASRQQAGRKR